MTSSEDGESIPPRDDTDQLPKVDEPGAVPPAPRRRPGWALIATGVVFVLLAVGLLIANNALGRTAEQRAADRAEAALGVPVDVTLSGWPVGLRLLTGQPIDVRLEAREVPLPGTTAILDRLELELEEVPVDLDALDQPEPELRAARGSFVAELGDDAVQNQIGFVGRIPLVDVELRSGVVRLNLARFPVIDATAEIDNGQVVFRPTAPIAAFASIELRLEELPFGFEATDVEIRRGVLRLSGAATDVRLAPPG